MVRSRKLRDEYANQVASLGRLQKAMIEQLEHLVSASGLTLGVPIESRVKTWDSIAEKLERKRLRPQSLSEIDDLLGLRVIFLFQRDLDQFHSAVSDTFSVIASEDTSQRLAEAQFGYKSRHYVVTLPDKWEAIPSLKGLSALRVEIQVRTLAQHIWAAASHKLQYKHEQGVPLPVRRSIYRVSALLETVDLELARVLSERDEYVKSQSSSAADADLLDVSVVERVLDELFPALNKEIGAEDYADLLQDLEHFEIRTRGSLRTVVSKHMAAILREEANQVRAHMSGDERENGELGERGIDRAARGVFFIHAGLARQALVEEFGSRKFFEWSASRSSNDKKSE